MPANAHSEPHRHHAGQGSGCAYLLEHGAMPDFAVIAKPGWAVSWEEVGLCWFKVTVRGTLNYTGIRHVAPYVNPIVEAAHVIEGLERWFAEYSERHASG
ncbi:MAG: deacylase, partial [Chloroflexi bacterium]|nr:deacylase [Chloroflexota bacterium]